MKILDRNFIKNNKYKCKIIYKNKIYELNKYIECIEDIDIKYNYKDKIKIKFFFINYIIDMSYMFLNCKSLIYLSINYDNTNPKISFLQIMNSQNIFYGCSSLISLPDISKWNISKVNNMSHMFYECNSLVSLPDISKWDTSNVNNMSFMFCECN